jgi:hypothetical protein
MTNCEMNEMEEGIAKYLNESCLMGKSDSVLAAHDIVSNLIEKYRIELHPYLDEKIDARPPLPKNPTYGEALNEVSKGLEALRDAWVSLLGVSLTQTNDNLAFIKGISGRIEKGPQNENSEPTNL